MDIVHQLWNAFPFLANKPSKALSPVKLFKESGQKWSYSQGRWAGVSRWGVVGFMEHNFRGPASSSQLCSCKLECVEGSLNDIHRPNDLGVVRGNGDGDGEWFSNGVSVNRPATCSAAKINICINKTSVGARKWWGGLPIADVRS